MILVVGLGNPGKKFEKTRHNVGFLVLNEFSKNNNFPKFKLSKKFQAEITEGEIAGQKVILAKPRTFMNLSGKCVKLLTKTYNLKPNNLIAIHDDLDLPLGKIKISFGRGAAGHKGVESIIRELKTKNFVRFRIGIKPKTYNLKPITLEKFVLQKFTNEEEKIVKDVIKKTAEAIEFSLKEGLEKAMNKYNR
jgi:PTH1 family peptidyl-tRNA hydrolase